MVNNHLKEKIAAALVLTAVLVIYYNSIIFGGKSFLSTIERTYRLGHFHYEGTYWHEARNKATIDPAAANLINMPSAYLEHYFLKSGQLPLWNPYSGLGRPYHADMNSYTFFLPLYPFKLWPSLIIYDLFLLLRLWLSGFFLFLLLRLYRCRFWLAVGGACLYIFNSYFQAYLDLDPLNVTMFLPAILYFLTKFVFSLDKKYLVGFVLSSAGSFYGGNPNEFILIHLFVIFYFLFLIFTKKAFDFRTKSGFLLSFIGALGLSFLLSAVKLLPFIEFWRYSLSARFGGLVGSKVFLPFKKFLAWVLLPNQMFQGPNYVGFLILSLVFYSVFNLIRKNWQFRERIVAFHFIVFLVLISKINAAPYINWIGQLPILNNIHYVKYCSLIYYTLSVMATLSLVYLREDIKKMGHKLAKLGLFLFCLVLPHLFLRVVSRKSFFQMADNSQLLLGIFIIFMVTGIGLICIKKSYKNKTVIGFALIIMIALAGGELRVNNHQYYRQRFRINDHAPYTQWLLKQKQPFRLIGVDGTFTPNSNLVFPLPSLSRTFAMRVKRPSLLLSKLVSFKFNSGMKYHYLQKEVLNNPYLDLLNLRYYVSESILDSMVINPDYARARKIKALIDNPMMKYSRCGNLYYYIHWGWRQLADSSVDIPICLPRGKVFLKSTAVAFNFKSKKRHKPGNHLELKVVVKHGQERDIVYHGKFSPHSEEAKDFFRLKIDLSQYAGQTVVLNFTLKNPRPEDINDRMFFWGNLRIVYNKIMKPLLREKQGLASPSLTGYELIPYEEVFGHHALVYKNNRALERGFMLYRVKTARDINEVLKIMLEKPELYKKVALIEGTPPSNIKIGKVGQSKISFIDYRPNYIIINLETSEDGIFILSDAFYPGWKAYLDRKRVKIYPAFGALRAVFIDKGRHQLVFTYRPWTFYSGVALTLMGLILVGWIFFTGKRVVWFS